MTLGEKIFVYRCENDLSQEQMGALIGVDRSYLGQIENGKRKPGKKTLYKLSKLLNGKK